MKKTYLKEQSKELKHYPIEVINSTSEIIEMLDYNYGANRNVVINTLNLDISIYVKMI